MEQKSVSYIYICISCEATDRRNQWICWTDSDHMTDEIGMSLSVNDGAA